VQLKGQRVRDQQLKDLSPDGYVDRTINECSISECLLNESRIDAPGISNSRMMSGERIKDSLKESILFPRPR
jgi:hypothetical protein